MNRIIFRQTLQAIALSSGLACVLFIPACRTQDNLSNTEPGVIRPEVVLIFKDTPNQSEGKPYYKEQKMRMISPFQDIAYIDSSYTFRYFTPRNIGYDTLVIPTFYGRAEVEHTYLCHETLRYLFKAGDTILFTYAADKRPMAVSKHSLRNTQLYNLAFDFPGYLEPLTGYSRGATLLNHLYTVSFRAWHYRFNTLTPDLKELTLHTYINLDSLEVIYRERQERFKKHLDSLTATGFLPADHRAFLYRNLEEEQQQIDSRYSARHNGFKKREISEPTPLVFNDSLAGSLRYQKQLFGYLWKLSRGNGRRGNPERGFDRVEACDTIPPATKKILLRKAVTEIIEGLPMEYTSTPEAEKKYREKYYAFTGDSVYLYIPEPKQNLLENGYSNDLLLEDYSGQELEYSALLKKHAGKVIYVDFWASWCGPCVALFPASKKLHREFPDVVFIYLAVGDKKEEWLAAAKRHGIEQEECYFVKNFKDNQFLQEINHTAIPHLLLYNPKGELVNIQAPRANTPEIKAAFQKLLSR